jgi:lysozyme
MKILEQAALFIKTVRLHKGDLPPVLDIERLAETIIYLRK